MSTSISRTERLLNTAAQKRLHGIHAVFEAVSIIEQASPSERVAAADECVQLLKDSFRATTGYVVEALRTHVAERSLISDALKEADTFNRLRARSHNEFPNLNTQDNLIDTLRAPRGPLGGGAQRPELAATDQLQLDPTIRVSGIQYEDLSALYEEALQAQVNGAARGIPAIENEEYNLAAIALADYLVTEEGVPTILATDGATRDAVGASLSLSPAALSVVERELPTSFEHLKLVPDLKAVLREVSAGSLVDG